MWERETDFLSLLRGTLRDPFLGGIFFTLRVCGLREGLTNNPSARSPR